MPRHKETPNFQESFLIPGSIHQYFWAGRQIYHINIEQLLYRHPEKYCEQLTPQLQRDPQQSKKCTHVQVDINIVLTELQVM